MSFDTFASREPYFSVLTSPKYLRDRLTAESHAEFFSSGERLIDALFTTIELRMAPHFAPTSVLEYGCGVGRLAQPLARHAGRRNGRVTAVDRSPAMLAVARREAAAANVDNIDWMDDAAFKASDRRFDLITCYLVLQRLPPAEGLALAETLATRLVTGGIGVFQFPYATNASASVRTTRWVRERVPGVNAAINRARRQPADQPFVPSHPYSLQDVLASFDRARFPAAHVVFDDHADLRSAIVIVERPLGSDPGPTGVRPLSDPIDVRHVIEATTIPDLNTAAEAYFTSLTDWDHHLAKPFSTPDEAPWLLANLTEVLHAARLRPGDAVLEFGAGTGWLSRFLTQLGCRVTLLDVSPTALAIAQALYARVPVVGHQPEPVFLPFDGQRIELADEALDRVISFHAFHHAPNPEAVLVEFARVLKPGGLAIFAEPGPRHSRTPQSQFEMRTYHVVENDVDVHALWQSAHAAGFARIDLSVFHGQLFQVSLDQYEDLLRGGPTAAAWTDATREFLRNVRVFVLTKAGTAVEDSRSAAGLACAIAASDPASVQTGDPVPIDVTISNTGTAVWLPAGTDPGGVALGVHVYGLRGEVVRAEVLDVPLTVPLRAIQPGETLRVAIALAPLAPGRYEIEIDAAAARITWFSQRGSVPARVTVNVRA